MNRNFNPESTNPRSRRAFAHAKISQYKLGNATYGEAFEAAIDASQTSKGQASNFGRALGGVIVDAYTQNFDNNTVVVFGLSPARQAEVAEKVAIGEPFSYRPDIKMLRPDANSQPRLMEVIHDPIAEGFLPYLSKA
jgi:hypothetical protein